jgi:hypothetical protein
MYASVRQIEHHQSATIYTCNLIKTHRTILYTHLLQLPRCRGSATNTQGKKYRKQVILLCVWCKQADLRDIAVFFLPCAVYLTPRLYRSVLRPRTNDQLQQQARLIKDLIHRQSQSSICKAISQLVKGCQFAMQSVTILAQKNVKLRAVNQRQKQER